MARFIGRYAAAESPKYQVARVEWANLIYALSPDASVRIGRIVLPTFMVADSRKVGYANPWVRPPVEVYGLVPITQSDGLDASYRVVWGETASSGSPFCSRSVSTGSFISPSLVKNRDRLSAHPPSRLWRPSPLILPPDPRNTGVFRTDWPGAAGGRQQGFHVT